MLAEPASSVGPYNPKNNKLLSFYTQREKFLSGEDTPRKYFERCLQVIEECNDEDKAWAFDNTDRAREMADAATKRYANQKPLSIIDNQPKRYVFLF